MKTRIKWSDRIATADSVIILDDSKRLRDLRGQRYDTPLKDEILRLSESAKSFLARTCIVLSPNIHQTVKQAIKEAYLQLGIEIIDPNPTPKIPGINPWFEITDSPDQEMLKIRDDAFSMPDEDVVLKFQHKNIIGETRRICRTRIVVVSDYNPDLEPIEIVNRSKTSICRALKSIIDCIEGLMHMHQLGYIHGDVKLNNLAQEKGKGLVCDIEGVTKKSNGPINANGLEMLGTNSYKDWQLYYGEGFLNDEFRDIYAIGITLLNLFDTQKFYALLKYLNTKMHLKYSQKSNYEFLCYLIDNSLLIPEDLKSVIKICVSPNRTSRPSLARIHECLKEYIAKNS